jgi:two-component system CheB/CheR fusion protein
MGVCSYKAEPPFMALLSTASSLPEDQPVDGLFPAFPIVGVGASAGGLEAFSQLLTHLPEDTGMAFVLVQHLDPKHESRLRDLLAKNTRMPVLEAAQGLAVAPDHVYIIPPNTRMTVAGGILQLAPRGASPHLPIDHFLQSLAEDRPAGALAVILSGTGSDGTLGLESIKGAGGITFAQDTPSAKYPAMPQSAVRGGCVDFVLTPEGIARELARIGRHPYLHPPSPPANRPPPGAEDQFPRILALLRAAVGVDFSAYRSGTIHRRVLRRMMLAGKESLADYAGHLETDRSELAALFQDLLINVTRFFREPETFEALKRSVFPEILKQDPDMPIRVWVPGCSTGQEVYSLAIVLLEFLRDQPVRPPIQIFATDLSETVALQKAREGVYPESIEGEVSAERLRLFFTKEDGKYRVGKAIRDICVFARQNVATDPPFSRVDLISCRNLLIYFSPQLQKRVLPTFHYALNPHGFLLLGAAETVGPFTELFEPVDLQRHLYTKKTTAVRQYPHFAAGDSPTRVAGARRAPLPDATPTDWQREADRILLGRYAPAGVLVDDNLHILQFRGQTSPYLAPAPGEASLNVLKMAREGLFLELRGALDECRKHNVRVRRPGVRVRGDDQVREVDLQVLPVSPPRSGERCYLVLFEEPARPAGSPPPEAAAPLSSGAPGVPDDPEDPEDSRLRLELDSTREYLQSVIEQQEAANEELRSANEEALSANEELQSTNEELETAKEELQSVNEELTTVNEQLQFRNAELGRLNDDFTNLLGSANLPMVVLGADLRIRRFTPAAVKLLNLLPVDVGRPIGDLQPNVVMPGLEALVAEVIAAAAARDREVRDRDGHWYALHVHPYRTADDRIDGAVVVLFDIDIAKIAQQRLQEADQRKTEFLATLAHELRNPLAPILNSLHLLERSDAGGVPAEKAREMVRRQVRHMTRLIDDLLDVSRITRGRIELRREPVELAGVVEEVVETCRPALDRAGHTLTVHLAPEPLILDADPVRLTQIVENLLSNAIKYSEHGGRIEVITGREEDEAVLRVRDAGIGITPEALPRIWDLFTQGDPSLETQNGLGIGLTVVRSLVHLHGGSAEGRSAGLGKGSEFIVRLPLGSSHAAAPE